MLKAALLTLTLTAAGDLRLTLSEMDDAAACEASRESVTELLTQAGVEVVLALCGESELRLTPFEHGADPADEKHFYRVEMGGDSGFRVSPVEAGESCTAAAQDNPQIYCARSSQSVVSGG